MSQHPSFPPHLPRGAVAASALTLPKNAGTTVLRAGTSPAIQIPAAPSVPSVSVSVAGLPAALSRNPVISAIRPNTPPSSHTAQPAASFSDHQRANLIVQGPGGAGTSVGTQPLQITLTQRVPPGGAPSAIGMQDVMKLTPLGGKTVQVAQPGLLQQKVGAASASAGAALAGMGLAPSHLTQSAVLNKQGALQVGAAMPAISISSLSAPLQTTTVMAPASTTIPIAKVPPQRQTLPLQAPIALQAMSQAGSEFTSVAELGVMASQAGASQLLFSQPQRSVGASQTPSSAVSITTALPAGPYPALGAQERTLQPGSMFNLTAAAAAANVPSGSGGLTVTPGSAGLTVTPGSAGGLTVTPGSGGTGQQDMWLSQLFYQQAVARGQLVSTPTQSQPLVRPQANTFFVPRPGADQTKITSQAPNLAASLAHPLPPAQPMLLGAHMMVDGLRQPLPLSTAMTSMPGGVPVMGQASISDHSIKPAISIATAVSGSAGIHASLLAASNATCASHAADFSSSTSLHIAASLASGSSGGSVLTPHPGLSAMSASRATVASSIIAAATAHQTSGSQPAPPTTMSTSSSPRPSILRKRTADGNTVMPRKPNFNLMAESHSPRPDMAPLSNISSPKTPATENSQSSTDTALSSNDAATPTHNSHGDVKVKTEPMEAENGPVAPSPAISLSGSIGDASPRKRARKQLFDVTHRKEEEVKNNSSTDDEEESKPTIMEIKTEDLFDHRDEYIDKEGVRWTRDKTKPAMSIMSEYSVNWKPRYNHFQRHSDVRPKDDRNPTVNELISQRGILQKASGWKLYYVSAQVEDVIENEQSMEERMEKLKERLAAKASSQPGSHTDYNKLLELTRGNLQRCQVVRQQLQEAKANMLHILRHQPKVKEIITKNLAKRTIKKKERS